MPTPTLTTYLRSRSRIPGLSYYQPVLRPSDLDSLIYWLKADAAVYKDTSHTACADNDTVEEWVSQGPYRFSSSQTTSGNRPTYKTAIINGFPVVRFNGSSSLLSANISGATLPVLGGIISFFFVIKPSSTTPIGIWDTAPTVANTFRNYNSGQCEWQNAAPQFNLSLANTNPVLLEFLCSQQDARSSNPGRSVIYYRNGVLVSTNTATGSVQMLWTTFQMGGINNGSNGWYNGDIAEVIIFTCVLSDTNRRAIENYLNVKYALW